MELANHLCIPKTVRHVIMTVKEAEPVSKNDQGVRGRGGALPSAIVSLFEHH